MTASFRISLGCVLACLLVGAWYLPSVAGSAEVVTPLHLVGHEDIALLDRVQDLIDDWDPRKLVNPLVAITEVQLPNGTIEQRKVLRRSDLSEFIADVEAVEVLGKALFWDIQAGSDFRRLADGKTFVGTACASCHYQHGADGRTRHTMRIPYVVWDQYELDPAHPLEFGEKQLPYDVKASATYEASWKQPSPFGLLSIITGSAGVEPRLFLGNGSSARPPTGLWESEKSTVRTLPDDTTSGQKYRPQWSMFIEGQKPLGQGRTYRQITPRNSPTVINSGFADRLFHDGRAESTFNGFSIFGDRDQRPVLYRGVAQRNDLGEIEVDANGAPIYEQPVSVHVAITKAALGSQAVGPILSDVEMSYLGRTFPHVACKLLDAKVLPYQQIDDNDSVLSKWKREGKIGAGKDALTYRKLITLAFRREWWDAGLISEGKNKGKAYSVPLLLAAENSLDRNKPIPTGEMMAANFSLYWGLSIMFYEASLVSNQSPFDGMMQGNPRLVEARWQQVKAELGPIRLDRAMQNEVSPPQHTTGTAVFQHGMRVFLNRGCVECHSGPLFSELYERAPEDEKFPIHERLASTLLPTSRADSISMRRDAFRDSTLQQVERLLTAAPLSLSPAEARRTARMLDGLREQARGSQATLQQRIADSLPPVTSTIAGQLANLLMNFERTAPRRFGNRVFFTEDERVAMAEGLVEPVLVEQMPIPPRQERTRPRLPIQGPLAEESYAFYDLAFYALGVSPPRYDSGIGDFESGQLLEMALDRVARDVEQEADEAKKQELRGELKELRTPTKTKAQQQPPSPELSKRLRAVASDVMNYGQNAATPGASNRFRAQSPLRGEKPTAQSDPGNFDCSKSPGIDDLILPQLPDRSWDRNFLPAEHRRSEFVFRSRARTLVTDEEPWGFRKPFLHDNELAFWGAFKTPTLRNVELTAPYMHNGRIGSLRDVIDFYDRGGDLEPDLNNNPDKHPEIVELNLTENDKLALRFFLLCLTDERVRLEQAPFDHPSLPLVHGYDDQLQENVVNIGSVGRTGKTPTDPR